MQNLEKKPLLSFNHLIDFFHFLFTDLEISKEAKFSFNLLHKCNFSVHLGDRSKTEQEIETNNWHPT